MKRLRMSATTAVGRWVFRIYERIQYQYYKNEPRQALGGSAAGGASTPAFGFFAKSFDVRALNLSAIT